jgi:hypothetical protein
VGVLHRGTEPFSLDGTAIAMVTPTVDCVSRADAREDRAPVQKPPWAPLVLLPVWCLVVYLAALNVAGWTFVSSGFGNFDLLVLLPLVAGVYAMPAVALALVVRWWGARRPVGADRWAMVVRVMGAAINVGLVIVIYGETLRVSGWPINTIAFSALGAAAALSLVPAWWLWAGHRPGRSRWLVPLAVAAGAGASFGIWGASRMVSDAEAQAITADRRRELEALLHSASDEAGIRLGEMSVDASGGPCVASVSYRVPSSTADPWATLNAFRVAVDDEAGVDVVEMSGKGPDDWIVVHALADGGELFGYWWPYPDEFEFGFWTSSACP